MVMRIIPLKKGTTTADRTIKFLGGYFKFISKEAQGRLKFPCTPSMMLICTTANVINEDSDTDTELTEKDLGPRFMPRLLELMLLGFEAKDKTARYRVLQLVTDFIPQIPFSWYVRLNVAPGSLTIRYMDDFSKSLLSSLHDALLERIWDKEAAVRAQAATALSSLMQRSDPGNSSETLDALLDMLKCDESP